MNIFVPGNIIARKEWNSGQMMVLDPVVIKRFEAASNFMPVDPKNARVLYLETGTIVTVVKKECRKVS